MRFRLLLISASVASIVIFRLDSSFFSSERNASSLGRSAAMGVSPELALAQKIRVRRLAVTADIDLVFFNKFMTLLRAGVELDNCMESCSFCGGSIADCCRAANHSKSGTNSRFDLCQGNCISHRV